MLRELENGTYCHAVIGGEGATSSHRTFQTLGLPSWLGHVISSDPELCAQMYNGMRPIDEILRSSGQFGPRVLVPDDADAQTKLLGFIARDPAWTARAS